MAVDILSSLDLELALRLQREDLADLKGGRKGKGLEGAIAAGAVPGAVPGEEVRVRHAESDVLPRPDVFDLYSSALHRGRCWPRASSVTSGSDATLPRCIVTNASSAGSRRAGGADTIVFDVGRRMGSTSGQLRATLLENPVSALFMDTNNVKDKEGMDSSSKTEAIRSISYCPCPDGTEKE